MVNNIKFPVGDFFCAKVKNMKKIILEIRRELKQNIDPVYREGGIRFFKEKIKTYGVRVPIARKISRKYFTQIKELDKNQIFALCEELLKSGYTQERLIAFDWAFRLKDKYQNQDFKIFESWLKKYVSNWGNCDDFCNHALGHFIFKFPEFLPKLKVWAKSKNRWLRRASAVILIYPIKREKYLSQVFEIADILLLDQDDLVQKGYGWMLKETSNLYLEPVFQYVMKNKKQMPRTALRYAIEKFPEKFRKKAMKK